MQKPSFTGRVVAKAAAISGVIASAAIPLASQAGTAIQNLQASMNQTANAAGVATTKTLPELVGSFISAALGLLGVVLVVLVIYAGFIWMTAQGNDEKIKKAKGMITSAVIGMIIIFAAYAITNFVVSALATSVGPAA
jgi:uncharacterized membrane protein YwzB